MKVRLRKLSERKPKPGLVKQLLTLIAKHLIKSGEEKDKNLYLLANNSPWRKDQQTVIWKDQREWTVAAQQRTTLGLRIPLVAFRVSTTSCDSRTMRP